MAGKEEQEFKVGGVASAAFAAADANTMAEAGAGDVKDAEHWVSPSYISSEKDAITSGKRKAEGSEVADEMTSDAAGAGDVKAADMIKWEEMPLEYIAWILSRKWEDFTVLTLEDHSLHRTGSNITAQDAMYTQEEFDEHREMILKSQATAEAGREEFFAFQAWVRETFERNGRVMVPEGFNGPNPCGNQDVIDEIWEQGKHELGLRLMHILLLPTGPGRDTGVLIPFDLSVHSFLCCPSACVL